MSLTDEEKAKLYEQEKARIEAENAAKANESDIKELKPNIAGLLCYLLFWVTGIIFLILEKKNQFVRFHAMQSIITFGALTIIAIIFNFIPFGWIINIIVFIL